MPIKWTCAMKSKIKQLILIILIFVSIGMLWILNGSKSPILFSDVRAVPVSENMYAVYMSMENNGAPDTLTSVTAKDAEKAFFMGNTSGKGLAVPEGAKPSLSPDGVHVMLMLNGVNKQNGEFIPLVLQFAKAGSVPVKAVISDMSKMGDMSSDAVDGKMDHSMHSADAVFNVESGLNIPRVEMSVQKAENHEWMIDLTTQNFEFFEPETDPAAHKNGQGHGHLYLNGLKLQRMYSLNARIGKLPPGEHIVSITLNTNDHRAYATNGMPISASMTIREE